MCKKKLFKILAPGLIVTGTGNGGGERGKKCDTRSILFLARDVEIKVVLLRLSIVVGKEFIFYFQERIRFFFGVAQIRSKRRSVHPFFGNLKSVKGRKRVLAMKMQGPLSTWAFVIFLPCPSQFIKAPQESGRETFGTKIFV